MSLTDTLRFAYVCPLAWEKLTQRSATTRHCDTCAETVTDLSRMPKSEADALLAAKSDAVCVRIARDAAGRSLHVPSLSGLAAVAALAGCMAPGGDTGDTAADTGDTAGDTAAGDEGSDAAGDEGDGTGPAGRSRGHRPVGTGLGEGAAGEDTQGDGSEDAAEGGGHPAGSVLDAIFTAGKGLVRPPGEKEPVYITMGVIARAAPPPSPPRRTKLRD